jgi:hypothetical protein
VDEVEDPMELTGMTGSQVTHEHTEKKRKYDLQSEAEETTVTDPH